MTEKAFGGLGGMPVGGREPVAPARLLVGARASYLALLAAMIR